MITFTFMITMTEYKEDKKQLNDLHLRAKEHYAEAEWKAYYDFKVGMITKYPQSYYEKGKMILIL